MNDDARVALLFGAYYLWPVIGGVIGFAAAVFAGVIASGRGRDGLIWFFITLLWTGASNGVVFLVWAGAFALRKWNPAIAILLAVLFVICNLPLVLLLMAGPKDKKSMAARRRRWLGLRGQLAAARKRLRRRGSEPGQKSPAWRAMEE